MVNDASARADVMNRACGAGQACTTRKGARHEVKPALASTLSENVLVVSRHSSKRAFSSTLCRNCISSNRARLKVTPRSRQRMKTHCENRAPMNDASSSMTSLKTVMRNSQPAKFRPVRSSELSAQASKGSRFFRCSSTSSSARTAFGGGVGSSPLRGGDQVIEE